MTTYLLDADTINYILKRRGPAGQRLRERLGHESAFVLSPVVHYQITRYLCLKDSHRLIRAYRSLTAGWRFLELTVDDWELAARLWAER